MTELEFMDILYEVLAAEGQEEYGVRRVNSFEEEGLLTRNAGLVVKMADGSEFQVTIVKSR